MSALLEVRGLRAGYEGIPVVVGLDLTVDAGEIVALLGSNGAGKTTTLRAISGMVSAMSGVVVFDRAVVSDDAPERIARRGLVHIPEGRGLFPNLSVGETLRLAGALAGVSKGALNERLAAVHETFPILAGRSGQTVGTLSGGEQQMLALARGLVMRPKLLMIDEMSQGLAPTIVRQLFQMVDVFRQQGTAVLLVEQFVESALAVADRAYIFEHGTITHEAPAEELRRDRGLISGSYLGSAPDSTEAIEVAANGNGHHRVTDPQLMEILSMKVPAEVKRALEERAEREGRSAGALALELLEEVNHLQ